MVAFAAARSQYNINEMAKTWEDIADHAIEEAVQHHRVKALIDCGFTLDVCRALGKKYRDAGYAVEWRFDHCAGAYILEIGGWAS